MQKINYFLGNRKCQIEYNKNGNQDNGRGQISKLGPQVKWFITKLRHSLYPILKVNAKIILKADLCIICQLTLVYKYIGMKAYIIDINVTITELIYHLCFNMS